MSKKKVLTVKTVLESLPPEDNVMVAYYAYGIQYADSWSEGMRTVADVLEQTRYDCLNAKVVKLKANWAKVLRAE